MAIPFLACMAATAAFYHLPPRVLPAIQVVEAGRVGSVSHNRDGSDALGVMQVNTLWLPALSQASRLPAPVVRARLADEPCFGIAAAGAIMRTYLIETKGDLMRAVGDYHSHTPALNQSYQISVRSAAARLFRRQRRPSTTGPAAVAAPMRNAPAIADAAASARAGSGAWTRHNGRPPSTRSPSPATSDKPTA